MFPTCLQVISPVPQIEQFRLETSWDFLVLATDGVWDAMANAEILKYIASRLDNKNR
jgi:serine/threonine protein phosphatase PrpC